MNLLSEKRIENPVISFECGTFYFYTTIGLVTLPELSSPIMPLNAFFPNNFLLNCSYD